KAWPTYRGDQARSGRTADPVPDKLSESWQTTIGGRLSSLVAAEGMVFVASIDRHRVFALDEDSGKQLWSYSAGARVDSPPTIYKGLVLFGSADGYIYAVRASDGILAWRFLAAPLDQRLTAFEQIESVWPVSGSVLVYDDTLYGVAGRSMFLDEGLRLWRLDPVTGAVKSETVLDENELETGKKVQDFISWLNMPVALPDILSCDGELVYMRSQPFRLDGTRLPLETMARAQSTEGDRGAPLPTQDRRLAHLFSPTGFLDDTNWHRTYWMYGSSFVSGWQGYYRSGMAAPAGKLLIVGDDRIYGFGRLPQYYKWTTPIEHQLFSAYKKFPKVELEGNKPAGAVPTPMPEYVVKHDWTKKLPLYVRAMVLAGDTLIVAGPEDTIDEDYAEQ
ncbi:MAG: PQQ-like beta-propeller repeat protein, partial [Planctomycetes bacterium]|nr:PQQ-like beta-propeller repeat protein [Planctomycetota bacterium]